MKCRYRKSSTNAATEILRVVKPSVGSDSEDTERINHQYELSRQLNQALGERKGVSKIKNEPEGVDCSRNKHLNNYLSKMVKTYRLPDHNNVSVCFGKRQNVDSTNISNVYRLEGWSPRDSEEAIQKVGSFILPFICFERQWFSITMSLSTILYLTCTIERQVLALRAEGQ